jgi:phosphoserine phosphatase
VHLSIAAQIVEMSKVMPYVATLIAAPKASLAENNLKEAIEAMGLQQVDVSWLAENSAADLTFTPQDPESALKRLSAFLQDKQIDFIFQPKKTRKKKLLIADMDSTMIVEECLDELARFKGLEQEISHITASAMSGEISFEAALKERVALLAGVTQEEIRQLIDRLTLMPGARVLVRTMRFHGAYTALISGGFEPFIASIATRLGFDETRANRLLMKDNRILGQLAYPVLGRHEKRRALEEIRHARQIPQELTLAVGDGANDLDMLQGAGLGVAYHAKPIVAQAAHARIDHADLTALLFAQGYRQDEFRQ